MSEYKKKEEEKKSEIPFDDYYQIYLAIEIFVPLNSSNRYEKFYSEHNQFE